MRPQYSSRRTIIRDCVAFMASVAIGCTTPGRNGGVSSDSSRTRVANPVPDCFGPESVVVIRAGHVGALRLDLPLDSLRHRCPNIRDTTANGDEELDTAITISRPGLRLVGKLALIESENGRQPVHFTGAETVDQWIVSGSAGRLPNGVPLTAAWRSLIKAYGPVASQGGANGDVFLSFCSMPGFSFSMNVPFAALIDTLNPAAAESTRLASPIESVQVPKGDAVARSLACR
jgi:hypothetical protein